MIEFVKRNALTLALVLSVLGGVVIAADYKPVHEAGLKTILAKTADYTLTAADYGKIVIVDSASGTVTLTLPAGVAGAQYSVVRDSATAGEDVIIAPASGEKINGTADGAITNDVDAVGALISITCIVDGEWVTSGAFSDF